MFLNNLKTFTAKLRHSPLLWSVPAFVFALAVFAPPTEATSFDQNTKELKQNNVSSLAQKHKLGSPPFTLPEAIQGPEEEGRGQDAQTKSKPKQDISEAKKEARHKKSKDSKKAALGRAKHVKKAKAAKARKHKRNLSPDGTRYPWAKTKFPNTRSDPWGMFKRQCVSYTAWKVAASGRHMPYWGGRGNAKNWDNNARRAGIPVTSRPRVGDVAISNYGTYGHAMYVEKVHRDGTITVSQYNAGLDGRYSEARRSAWGLAFIHFRW